MRYEDTPGLFGSGYGVSTTGTIHCDLCGMTYNEPPDDLTFEEAEDYVGDVSVCFTQFAGIQACDCCFEKIENEMLGRIGYFLTWASKIIKKRRELIDMRTNEMKEIAFGLLRDTGMEINTGGKAPVFKKGKL